MVFDLGPGPDKYGILLSFDLLRLQLEKSRIGFGFDGAGDEGPRYTYRRVVADIPLARIGFAYNDEGHREVLATECSRKSAYLRAGWADASLAAKTPWADVGVEASSSYSSSTSQFQKRAYVTGRYNFAHATISMKDYVAQLKPHPEFEKAVMDALATPDEEDRTKEIQNVLQWYGSMFIVSVEVGGMKHSTIERILDEKTTETSAKKEMSVELNKQLGSAEVEAKVGGGNENKQTLKQNNESDSLHFITVGGAIEASSFTKWKESLSSPRSWGVTRVREVRSVLSLFTKEVQTKIALAAFKTPLYQFKNLAGRHCMSTDPDPSKLSANYGERWTNHGSVGTVLTAPLDGAVPFYHVHDHIRHVFTNDRSESNDHTNSKGFQYNGVTCYVHSTQKPGTVRFNRTWWGAFFYDNAYSTAKEDVEAQTRAGYVVDDYFNCYIYPA
ncbi:hypothetical protein M407DRAFT_23483 [Tulasnella calospora MUT 4182]|uniref:Uncharacterized protein n=1 Tax=Tulasnella calospora MUT 4182 TaxID=1051891 RepID=A0A0C3L0T8_9AGAM|nr:hypothetical protein M407DRAFT_23483 [Tulasnella calospora MUT 4182]